MLIYEVKLSMYDAICISNTQKTSKKIMDGHFYDLLRHLKNGQKPDSFAAHFEHRFKYNTSYKDLFNCMGFKLVNQTNPIGAIKKFTKPN